MKYTICAVLAALAATMTACKSTGVDRAQETSGALRASYKALEAAPAKIDAVTASLTELGKGEGDMVKQYQKFGADVDALLSHRAHLTSLRKSLESDQAEFAKQWEMRLKDIKDEDLRARADERKKALSTEFGKIQETASAGREAFEPWIQEVIDLRAYLENDLNPGGVASVSDKIAKITTGAAPITDSVKGILTQMGDLADKIEATKPAPPAEGGDTGS